ncbi:sensor histidine kinase [Pelagibius litoralis]|nr:HAMP domain-containing sensor histidine kinase [Pelagibius litoralis]
MTDLSPPALQPAIDQLLSSGKLGVVLLDKRRQVEACFGVLATWVPLDCDACEAMPFLIGYEDMLDAVSRGEEKGFDLPNLGLIDAKGPPSNVLSIQAFPKKGEHGVVLYIQDATDMATLEQRVLQQRNELALAERALRQATLEAEAASRTKSAFLANVSHELRTPLNVIIGNAEILSSGAERDHPREDFALYVKDIYDNGHYLMDLINDLLDLSKAEAGRMDLVEEEVDLADLVAETLALAKALPFAKRLSFVQRMESPPILLHADRRRLKQVMLNLLSNASKFTPDGGEIIVHAHTGDDGLVLKVKDNGIGIAVQDLARLNEPFVQLTSSGNSIGGTGLGLHLVKTMVKLHQGHVEIESVPKAGTCVTLTFPMARVVR